MFLFKRKRQKNENYAQEVAKEEVAKEEVAKEEVAQEEVAKEEVLDENIKEEEIPDHLFEIPILSKEERMEKSEEYWTRHNVTASKIFEDRKESLEYFIWRNIQYPGYIEKMPVNCADGKVVLDYGCGPGNDVVGFSEYSKAKKIIAMDVSSTALELARKRAVLHNDENIEYIEINEEDDILPLENGSVDIIHSSGVLHHTPDMGKILNEFYRILKDDGYCQIMVYNYDSLYMHLYVCYHAWLKNRKSFIECFARRDADDKRSLFKVLTDGAECPIANCYTEKEFTDICKESGFKVELRGNSISKMEIDMFKEIGQEAADSELLDEESKTFLKGLYVNEVGIPCNANGLYAGIGSCYKLTKK